MEKIVRDTENKLDVTITDDFRNFVCDFYTEALAGMIINLFQQKAHSDRAQLYEYVSIILNSSLPAVLTAQKQTV